MCRSAHRLKRYSKNGTKTAMRVVKYPVVYCAEEVNNESNLCGVILDSSTVLREYDDGTILAYGYCEVLDSWNKKLYFDQKANRVKTSIRFVPYYSWGNRGKEEMAVWLRGE